MESLGKKAYARACMRDKIDRAFSRYPGREYETLILEKSLCIRTE